METKKIRSHCPIAYAMDFFGDKWSLLIIRDLLFSNGKYFKDFMQADENIATNILSDRLRKLEESGIIGKRKDSKNKLMNVYFLTRKGLELTPVLLEIIRWSAKNDPLTEAPKPFVRELNKDRGKLMEKIISSYKNLL